MIDLMKALADLERNRRFTNLYGALLEVRNKKRRLTRDEGMALFRAWLAEADRPQFDGPMYEQLWLLLEYAPAVAELTPRAERIMANPRMAYRGCAARYLLHAYPRRRKALIARHQDDADPEVRDAMARAAQGVPTWAPMCNDCLQLFPRVAECNGRGPTMNLDLAAIVGPHPALESAGAGQARHVHEGEAFLYHCEHCGAWWDICLWYGVGYIYIDERSPGWVKGWLEKLAPPPEQRVKKASVKRRARPSRRRAPAKKAAPRGSKPKRRS
jgi:hypothetical protein